MSFLKIIFNSFQTFLSLKKIFFCLMFIYFWERERDRARAGEGQRERETEFEAGFRLWAVSTEPNVRLKIMNCEIMTWAEVRHSTDWATQAPHQRFLFFFHNILLLIYISGSKSLPYIFNTILFYFILSYFIFYSFFWETEREWVGDGQRETHTHTESKPGSRFSAISTEPDVGLKLTNHEIMTWAA